MMRIAANDLVALGERLGVAPSQIFSTLDDVLDGLGMMAGDEDEQQAKRGEIHERRARSTKWLSENLAAAADVCGILEMPVSEGLLREAAQNSVYSTDAFNVIRSAILREMTTRALFFMPTERARHYERDDLVLQETRDAFPGAVSELRVAGNAFACGLHTASVLHAMRAAEIGMRSLATALECSFPKPLDQVEWHPLLEQCEAKIAALKSLPASAQKAADQKFYSEAAMNFRYFKDGYRVYAAHARASFTEHEARTILSHTANFFDALARRLNEGAASSTEQSA